jgi:hypothetical protein
MEDCELETHISWTKADLEAGFFFFYTSRRPHFERLLRKIGGKKNLLECTEQITAKGAFLGALCKVPAQYLSERGFAVRSHGKIHRSETQIAALKAYHAARRSRQLTKPESPG